MKDMQSDTEFIAEVLEIRAGGLVWYVIHDNMCSLNRYLRFIDARTLSHKSGKHERVLATRKGNKDVVAIFKEMVSDTSLIKKAPHPPFRHPLPKGRGRSYIFLAVIHLILFLSFPITNSTNFFLAPYGERMPAGQERGCLYIVLRLIQYSSTEDIACGLVDIIHGKFTEDILSVGVDCMERRETLFCNILCRESKSNILEDLGLCLGERDQILLHMLLWSKEKFGHSLADIAIVINRIFDTLTNLVHRRFLEQNTELRT
jgi:hypothetical protein